jgi:hypothetical protein
VLSLRQALPFRRLHDLHLAGSRDDDRKRGEPAQE